jgi:hypothetical protein
MRFDRPPEKAPGDINKIPTWVHRTGRELYNLFFPEISIFLENQRPEKYILVSGSIMETRDLPLHYEQIIGCQHYIASELEDGLLVASHPNFLRSSLLSLAILNSGQWAFEKHYIGIDVYLRNVLAQDHPFNTAFIGSEKEVNSKLYSIGSTDAFELIEGPQPGGGAFYSHGFYKESIYLAVGARPNVKELRCKRK